MSIDIIDQEQNGPDDFDLLARPDQAWEPLMGGGERKTEVKGLGEGKGAWALEGITPIY